MWIANNWTDYEVLDCGGGEKLERWGSQLLQRPDPQAIWPRAEADAVWRRANAVYHRSSSGGGKWEIRRLPEQWAISYKELTFQLKPMSFKHTGLFPEQATNWDFIMDTIRGAGRPVSVLNLFAYTGGATLAAAAAGASVCHVDASKGMTQWARENAAPSGLAAKPGATARRSSSARSGAAGGTTRSSWTRRPTGAAPRAKRGRSRRTWPISSR